MTTINLKLKDMTEYNASAISQDKPSGITPSNHDTL